MEGSAGDGTVALAKDPNVSVKVSASPGISREPYPFRDVAGHLKRVFERIRPATQLLGHRPHELVRQGELSPADLSFMSEEDKDWVMGRAIMQRLKWT